MSGIITQRDVTRNQSAADFSRKCIFLFGNTFHEGLFKNNTGAEYVLKAGTLVLRDSATPTQLIPAVAGASLANVVGIVKLEEDVTLAIGGTLNINYGINGDIDETELELPATVTLDTVPTGMSKTLKDYLHALGFSLKGSVQNTKFDN